MRPWIGFDLDGSIAHDEPGAAFDPLVIGAPIPAMIERIKKYLADGYECRIVTARVALRAGDHESLSTAHRHYLDIREAIETWCLQHIGVVLPITCSKDYGMVRLYDDRARQVERNTGRVIGE